MLCLWNSIKSLALFLLIQRECISYLLGEHGLHRWSIESMDSLSMHANICKSRHRNCRTLNYHNLEVYNWFFPSATRPKMRNPVSHWGPDSLNYITTFAVLAAHLEETHNPCWLRIQPGCRLLASRHCFD